MSARGAHVKPEAVLDRHPRPHLSSPAHVKLVAAFAVLSISLPARADGLDAGATDRVALDVPADAVLIALGGIGSLVPQIFKSQLTPAQCRWCGANAVDRFFHDGLVGRTISRQTANTVSNVTAFALVPATALSGAIFATGPRATSGAGLRATVIVVEGGLVAVALTQVTKLAFARARPYVVYGHPSQPHEGNLYDFSDPDSRLSFPSTHDTIAAALGIGAAMTATLEESPAAPWLWGAAGVLMVSTGLVRMMAEKHWVSDDLAGIVIGGGCGVLFPLLHRRGSLLGGSAPLTSFVSPLPAGMSLGMAGSF